jgi:hypothetical protein
MSAEDLAAIFYPSLVICGLVSIIIGSGIIFSYIWLKIVHKRLTRCPACQQPDAAELLETAVIDSRAYMDYKHNPPLRVTEKTHEDRYKCRFCGHEWGATFKQTEKAQVKSN